MNDRQVNDALFESLLREATRDVMALSSNSTLLNGRFVITRRLGNGGMGVVYEALDNAHDTTVALKVLSDINPAGIYRLKQEFRALVDVSHPNLVVLHELFVDRHIWFLTMELVVGQPLIQHLNVSFDLSRLKQVFRDLADGIHAIHRAGKLHRDLKPNNVLVTAKGHVKILDFGLVSDQEAGGVGQTVLDEGVSGTPVYMAPEQAGCEPAVRATDWYAFGAMLFEVLTGRPPFEDTPHRVLKRKQSEDAPRPAMVAPGIAPELDQLCHDLLQRDPSKRPGYDAIVAILGDSRLSAIPAAPDDEAPFVGREFEMRRLHDALRATDRGMPEAVFVTGPSGIGKSTLVERFLERVELTHNAVVLRGRCYERESVPYKACDSLIDDLTHYLRRLPVRHAARLMPRHVSALAKIFPVLNRLEVVRDTRQRFRLPPNPNQLRMLAFDAAKEMLARISSQERLIVYVDDLQWSDIDGIKMLATLVSPSDPPSLLLIGAYRSEDISSHKALSLLRERLGHVSVRDIRLAQLNGSDAEKLADNLIPTPNAGLASRIAREAQGNPYLISELARYAAYSGVDEAQVHLGKAIEDRVSKLSKQAKRLMRLIAVAGRPVEVEFLGAAMNGGNIAGPLRTLAAVNLIRYTGQARDKVACYHDRIRETFVDNLSLDALCRCHARLAVTLESEKNPDPVMLTEHLLGAGEREKAADAAVKAARRASESLAFENAARFYRIALDLSGAQRPDAQQIRTSLGEALAHAGLGAEAAAAFMQAAQGAPAEEALSLRCQAAQQWINTGHTERGTAQLAAILKVLGLKLHESERASARALLFERLALKLSLHRLRRRPPQAATAKQLLELRASEAAVFGLWTTDNIQSTAYCTHYLRCALKTGVSSALIKGLCTEAAFRAARDVTQHATSARLIARAEALAAKEGDPESLAYLKISKGIVAFCRGHILDAVYLLERAERYCLEECTRKSTALEMCQAFLGTSYSRLGRWTSLRNRWDRWVAAANETGNLLQLAICRMWFMGTMRWLADDQVDTARRQLETAVAECPGDRFDIQVSQTYLSRCHMHLYQREWRAAFNTCIELAERLRRSQCLRRVKLLDVIYRIDFAASVIAHAAETPRDKSKLALAKRQVAGLSRNKTEYTQPYIHFFNGALANITGAPERCIASLSTAARLFDDSGFHIHAAAVNRRLGRLIGGDEGRALAKSSAQVMLRERIANPDAVLDLITPGFPE